ncbi:unnamed protein product [Schistosoma guineensis]|nr:unnamed protein product [Schistosoma guineensis]
MKSSTKIDYRYVMNRIGSEHRITLIRRQSGFISEQLEWSKHDFTRMDKLACEEARIRYMRLA